MELKELNAKLKGLYSKYEEISCQGDFESALEAGLEIFNELLTFVKANVVDALANPFVREVALGVLIEYERGLSFVKGAREAFRSAPPLYASSIAEQTLEALNLYLNGLFNFAVGALLIMADLSSYASS
ncbi:MAG: hypothetical protein QXG48_02320 [Thermofilaceae archaeon]